MVYESDFYTTRRPYSRPSPTITSYTVTHQMERNKLTPAVGQAHTYHPSIPFIAHKRLNFPGSSTPLHKVKNAAIYAELDRIKHRNFDDEAKSIRAQTAALLKRVHTPIPRAVRPLPISGNYDSDQDIEDNENGRTSVDEMSDRYLYRLIDSTRNVRDNVKIMSHYPKQSLVERNLGKGHLACMSYAGGRGYPRRKYLISPEEREEQRHIKDEILYRSYYDKFRSTLNDSNTGIGGDKGPLEHVVA